MDEFVGFLIVLGIVLFISGPIAVVLAIVLFNKLGEINRRLNKLEGKSEYGPYGAVSALKPTVTPVQSSSAEAEALPQSISQPTPPTTPFETPKLSTQPITAKPINEVAVAVKTYIAPKSKSAAKGGLELKIGTTVALIVGVITVIIGVGFFLKYVYDNMTFSEEMRVCMVAVGGLVAIVIGEMLRRRNYEIVAKGIAALGFVLLYAAVFSGSHLYQLFSTEWAFAMLIVVTAGAMAYAVALDEVIIAFLALLGAYLLPVIILTGRDVALVGQHLPILLFGYLFILSSGAIGCAMFRRWRAVNWVAMVGTYLLYTIWFEQFYASDQIQTGLFWLGLFGCMYLVLPILNGLVKKIIARSEDVTLVVVNSIPVYYYLWQMLYDGSRQDLAAASGILGFAHIALVFVVLWRCSEDKKLQASLGVLGTAFITAAIPMYFNALQPTLIGWSIEAVVLTFIDTRYKSLWTKSMAALVSAIAAAGLFFHLPLHTSEHFRLVFNSPFGTWLWVCAAILVCHGLWRFTKDRQSEGSVLMAQVYYAAGLLLLAVGCALEWYAWCDWNIEVPKQGQAWCLMGTMVFASLLIVAFLSRPVCPSDDFVHMVGMVVTVIGSAFTALAMMGVYYDEFKLFLNVPVVIAGLFVASVFYGAWRIKYTPSENNAQTQLPGAIATMGLVLVLVLLSEQIYMYWYCRNQYGSAVSNWQTVAFLYMFMLWAVSGVMMLFLGIRFNQSVLKALAVITSVLPVAGLFLHLPLHFKGDFQFVLNQPFMAWVCVSLSLLLGHGLWRFMTESKGKDAAVGSQVYYAVGLVLLAIGCVMEWYAHCEYQIVQDAVGSSNFMLGVMVLCGLLVLSFLAHPLPPRGPVAQCLGTLTALAGAVWTVLVMTEVYHDSFVIFANVPFMIAVFFVASVLLAAWLVKRGHQSGEGRFGLSAALVLGVLILVWVLLSEQIYQYFWCQNKHVQTLDNWRRLSQMYMSVAWAIYAAVLVVLGFITRTAGIRYLSLLIFAVLLGKINLDIWHLGTEYRIATFLTTGLILVGVSFLYQFLKNKGFFDTVAILPENDDSRKLNNDA